MRNEPARAEDPRIGQVLEGRFTLVEAIGRGAMGAVYRAVQHSMDREVAIKVLHRAIASEEAAARRFLREARGASRLRHPNIVTIVDFGRSEEGDLFLAMELLEGRSLRDLLAAEGPLDLERGLAIVGQVCDAMAAAHDSGVVHCDLKPENIFLVRGGSAGRDFVKVIDFGIAAAPGTTSSFPPPRPDGPAVPRRSRVFGTPEYMSPEQALGLALDGRSDVYAISVLTYELLTGRPPFTAATAEAVLDAHLRSTPLPPRALRPDLPEAVSRVLLEGLAKDPDERIPSARLLGEHLDAAARGVGPWAPAQPSAPAGPRTNLVVPPTSFVGRGQALAELEALFGGGERLVTLHGPAGIGKTRLAVEHALGAVARRAYPGGVWLADLSEAMTVDSLCHEVARALRVLLAVDGSETDQAEQIGRALRARGPVLLVLDNFEQLVGYGAATLGRWAAVAEEARLLVTSRERLRLPGETVVEVGPLGLPSPRGERETSEAVALFLERSKGSRHGLAPDAPTRRVVAEIVRRLDGMPLGIELAAARLEVLGAEDLLDRLRRRLDVLSPSGEPDRRATLRGAIDWSWSLLAPWEASALAQMSVFVGGFTLEAAEAVVDLSEHPGAPPVAGVAAALLDKSLLRAVRLGDGGEPPRLTLYKSIRDFAEDQLSSMGGVEGAVARHRRHFVSSGRRWARGAHGHGGARFRGLLALERGNLLAVHRRALAAEPVSRDDAAAALEAVLALDPVLSTRGPFRPHLGWLDAAVAAAEARGLTGDLLVRAHLARGEARRVRMLMDAAEADFQRALDLARVEGHRGLEGRALFGLGMAAHRRGREREASPLFEQALAIHREVSDREAEGRATGMIGVKLLWVGHLAESRAYLEAALDCLQETGDQWFEGFLRGCLAWLDQERGDFEAAREGYRAALAALRAVGAARYEALFTRGLGCLAWEEGGLGQAGRLVERALAMARETGDQWLEAHFRAVLAAIHADAGRLAEARAELELAQGLATEAGTPWLLTTVGLHEGNVLVARARLARDGGEAGEAELLAREARERIEAARSPGPPDRGNPAGTPPLVERSDEVRFALRMLGRALGRLAED